MHLPRQKAVIAGIRQERSAHDVVRLGELADSRLGPAVVVGEGNRVPSRNVRKRAGGLRKEPLVLIELRNDGYVLVLASQFVQHHFAP